MCDEWGKPRQGSSLSIKCKCGDRIIRKDADGVYVPLIKTGAILRNVGYKTLQDAIEAYE